MTKIAVGSTDGITIDEHFGRTKEFLIYDIFEDGSYKLSEKIQTSPHCSEEDSDGLLSSTIELLNGINVVLVKQIGKNASIELEKKGILSFSITGPIDKALKSYIKRGAFLKNILKNPVDNTQSSCNSNSCNTNSCGCSSCS